MRRIPGSLLCLAALAALALSACATAPVTPPPSAAPAVQDTGGGLPNGAWVGELVVPSAEQAGGEERIFMVLYACGKDVRYYLRNAVTGGFESPLPALEVASRQGIHHLRYTDWNRAKADDWVETQSLDVVELDGRHARAWWSRTVSNRDLPAGHARRVVREHGSASFKRHSTDCPREAKERVVDRIHVPFDPDRPEKTP